MKKFAFCLSSLIATASASLFAAPASYGSNGTGQQGQMMQTPDCSQLRPDEQIFAAQIMDMNNRAMFCSQFSRQQRQQAMQMNGQRDDSGNVMNADQAVQQAMGSAPMMTPSTQQKSSNGGCPVQ
jgi:hypothetical protein